MEKCYVCGNALEVIKDKPCEYTECGLPVLLLGITQYTAAAPAARNTRPFRPRRSCIN